MTAVSHFAQYLLKLDPTRSPARACLYNFVKHLTDPKLPFTPSVLQTFYARVLQFDHWQRESQALADTVRADLQAYLKDHSLKGETNVWSGLRHADELQVVKLNLAQDLSDLAHTEHESRLKAGDQLKTIALSESQILVLLLSPTGNLEVKVYPNLALVWGSRLRLVAPVSQLYYSSQLELMPQMKQVLEGSLMTIHSFSMDLDGVHGLVTRGHTLQKFETFIRAQLSETKDLFHSLKRLEKHYINPQSDPYYQELVGRLERANRMVGQARGQHLAEIERVLGRARSSLNHVFPNDRLLSLLVTHLEYGLSQNRPPEDQAQPEPRHSPQQIPR